MKEPFYKSFLRAIIEIGFIIFLFYANLLMGEFTRTNDVQGKTFLMAMGNVFTATNFLIANVAAIIGFFVFEFLRRRFK
jgi:hypothetical protein